MLRAGRFVFTAVLASLAACSEPPTSVRDPVPPGFDAVVSDPFIREAAGALGTRGALPGFSASILDRTVFVSVPPATVPEAELATVVNMRTLETVRPVVLGGGFDPIGLRAEAGDTIVTTMAAGSTELTYARSVVPARRRPRVVRTSPARGRSDVAINAVITVIFSEPIDPASVTPRTVTLLRGVDTVAAVTQLDVGPVIAVQLAPAAPLAPGIGYTLLIAGSIRDLAGDALEPEAPIEFTTNAGPSTPPPSPPAEGPASPEPVPPAPPPGAQIPAGARLDFTTQPGNATAFTRLAPAVTVTVREAQGGTVTGYSGPVTILLGAPESSPRQGAQWQATAVGGVAQFSELIISDPGEYTLVASVEAGLTATSDPFTVVESPWAPVLSPSGPATRVYAASAVLEGMIYHLGGTTDDEDLRGAAADVDAYDPATNTWHSRAPLPEPRARAGAGVLDGILYVVGGSDASGTVHASVYAYDPATDSWAARAPLPRKLTHPGVGTLNGKLYVVGGIDDQWDAVALVSAYDPVTDAWTPEQPMGTARGGPGISVVGGTLYALGGGYGSSFVDDVEAYDPSTGSWSVRRSMPGRRGFMGVAASEGLIYAIGGFVDEPFYHWVGRAEVYDPLEDRWSVIPSIPSGGQAFAGTIDGSMYALGGWGGVYRLGP